MEAKHTPGQLTVAVEIFDNDGMPETAIQGLDGSATVAVALQHGRQYLGCELNPEYGPLQDERIANAVQEVESKADLFS